jgi:hypothetical protein
MCRPSVHACRTCYFHTFRMGDRGDHPFTLPCTVSSTRRVICCPATSPTPCGRLVDILGGRSTVARYTCTTAQASRAGSHRKCGRWGRCRALWEVTWRVAASPSSARARCLGAARAWQRSMNSARGSMGIALVPNLALLAGGTPSPSQ